jgi:hypothetical protein
MLFTPWVQFAIQATIDVTCMLIGVLFSCFMLHVIWCAAFKEQSSTQSAAGASIQVLLLKYLV